MPLAEFHVRSALDYADLSTPAGRDHALDEIAPVLGAMGESISRDELARLVADRLDADPGLVTRRVRGESADPRRAVGDGAPRTELGGHPAKRLRRDR